MTDDTTTQGDMQVSRNSIETRVGPRDWFTGAAAFELTPEDWREIEDAASRIRMQDATYPEHLEWMTNR